MTIQEAVQLAWQQQRSGNLAQVEQIARQILAVAPNDADAWQLLGVVAYQTGQLDAALEYLNRAVSVRPTNAAYLSNLGLVYHALGRLDEAMEVYSRALQLAPQSAEALNNLANVLKDLGRLGEAIEHYERALRFKPEYVDALHNLAGARKDGGQLLAAVEGYRKVLLLRPGLAEAHRNLGNALLEQGRLDEALASFDAALASAPADGLKIRSALALPVIPQSREEIETCRRRLSEQVDQLLSGPLTVADPVKEIGLTPFYLAYHDTNDRDLLAKIAALSLKATPSLAYTAPHCAPGAPHDTAGRLLKVGFISKFFCEHSVGRHFAGVIRDLARPEFHVAVFRFPGPDDALAREIRGSADTYVMLSPQLEIARQQIADARLDALVFTDIGMEPWTYFLAFSRLARVQCGGPGHPVTSGIPTIDYYLSSHDLEPPDGQDHYTEKLVRFQSFPTTLSAPRPAGPPRQRSDFGLPNGAHIYLCAQTLFKIHPDFDAMAAAILRADPHGRLVLFAAQEPHWTELIERRLRPALGEAADRLQFVPRQETDAFRRLLALADVVLDTPHFSGDTTSLEALAAGTPIVTLPGRTMRSRQTYAWYRKLGLSACVARDTDDYVRLAVRLGTDTAWRNTLRAELLAKRATLIENSTFVRELEQFLRDVIRA